LLGLRKLKYNKLSDVKRKMEFFSQMFLTEQQAIEY